MKKKESRVRTTVEDAANEHVMRRIEVRSFQDNVSKDLAAQGKDESDAHQKLVEKAIERAYEEKHLADRSNELMRQMDDIDQHKKTRFKDMF